MSLRLAGLRFIAVAIWLSASSGCSGDLGPGRRLPPLESSVPADGAVDVARTEWIRLSFTEDVDPGGFVSLAIACGDQSPAFDIDPVGSRLVVLNPKEELPPASHCEVTWTGAESREQIAFDVAAAGEPATVPYDPGDPNRIAPFPDDMWLDGSLALPTPEGARGGLFAPLAALSEGLDGFSPIGAWVIELPGAADVTRLPRTPAESLGDFAAVALYDVTPGGSLGTKMPIEVQARSEQNADDVIEHALVVIPSHPLTPHGRYALVVERRAFVDPSRPFEAAPVMRAGLGLDPIESEVEQRVVDRLREPLQILHDNVSPPRRADDIALVVTATIRSIDTIADDLLAIRAQLEAMPAPTFDIDQVVPDADPQSPVAASVFATWHAPSWTDGTFLYRDADGVPQPNGTVDIPFVITLPKTARSASVPLVMYQHGWPGVAEFEVPRVATNEAAAQGFALAGFTDIAFREVATDLPSLNLAAFTTILAEARVPDYLGVALVAEELSFLRLLPELASLDVLPVGDEDGIVDLDTDAPGTLLGISQGAAKGIGLVPYAPELRAAALVTGAGRLSLQLLHQQADNLYEMVASAFPGAGRVDLLVGLTLFQMGFDAQDPMNHAAFVYRSPLDLGTAETRASILLIEGLGDELIPAHNTRGTASALGLQHMLPVIEGTPILEHVASPVEANIDAATTGVFFQFAASGLEGIAASPGCEDETNGHVCGQRAPGSIALRQAFLKSAIMGGTPVALAPSAR